MNPLFPFAQEACLSSLEKAIILTRKLVPDGLIDITGGAWAFPVASLSLARTRIDSDSITGVENATLESSL